MTSVLVTGATGLLGSYLLRILLEDALDASGTHLAPCSDSFLPPGRLSRVDLRDSAAVRRLFERGRPEVVVHLASVGDVDACERQPVEARRSIVDVTEHLLEGCDDGVHFIYISTNAVFSGEDPPYSEDSPPAPLNEYGRLKLEAERRARSRAGLTTIVRPILAYGWPLAGRRDNPVTWLLQRLRAGQRTKLVTDVWCNPLYAADFGQCMIPIIRRRLGGIFHVAGPERMDRYEMGVRIARHLQLDSSLLEPVTSAAFPNIARRPRDTTYASRRTPPELGIECRGLEVALDDMMAHRSGAGA